MRAKDFRIPQKSAQAKHIKSFVNGIGTGLKIIKVWKLFGYPYFSR